MELRLIRPGVGSPPLTVTEEPATHPEPAGWSPLLQWVARPGHPFSGRLYASGTGYELWTDALGRFEIEPRRPAITVPAHPDALRVELALWGLPAALCFAHRGDLALHAAAVQAGRSALLLAAPGGFGKTTLAAAFHAAGHRVLAEDTACCRPTDPAAVLPGPAVLRMRPDALDHLDLPAVQVQGSGTDRPCAVIDGPRRGDGAAVPLAGIVFLRPGTGPPRLEPVAPPDSIRDLWALCARLPTEEDRRRAFAAVASMAASVPTWNLYRPLRYETLAQTVELLVHGSGVQ